MEPAQQDAGPNLLTSPGPKAAMTATFENSYAHLGNTHSLQVTPTPVEAPEWMLFNDSLATDMDWPTDWRQTPQALACFAGNVLFGGSNPTATVYAGHQFGSYNPQLGDGRAILLGEWLNGQGKRQDIQLKGAGPTPFSRGGDGRSPVGPVVREFLVSEAMHALGVPTTRALAAVASGERVFRNHPEPGAVLTRVASSHLRIGTVQYFAMTQGGDGLEALVDHVVARHFDEALEKPENAGLSQAAVLLTEVAGRLSLLAAHWQRLGFIHGVLNTDNMLLCGETIDYGPCAFMDGHDPARVFSSIDTQGRYAYRNQPGIVHWNLSVLAQCLLPLIDSNEDKSVAFAQAVIDAFPQQFTDAYGALMAQKFGLSGFREGDTTLIDGFFTALAQDELDFSLAFRWLTETAQGTLDHSPVADLFTPNPALLDWLESWQARHKGGTDDIHAAMRLANPAVVPRNHWIAAAIADAEAGDYALMQRLFQRWQQPADWLAGDEQLAAPPTPDEVVTRTFCGT